MRIISRGVKLIPLFLAITAIFGGTISNPDIKPKVDQMDEAAINIEIQKSRIAQILKKFPQLAAGYVLQGKDGTQYAWMFKLMQPEFPHGPIPVTVLAGASDGDVEVAILAAVGTAKFYEFLIEEAGKKKKSI